jgi:hypothetical protein
MNSESVLNVQVVTTEPTSSARAADQIVSEFKDACARQANSNGTKVEMTSFRHSDVVDRNVNHESGLNGSLVPEKTVHHLTSMW